MAQTKHLASESEPGNKKKKRPTMRVACKSEVPSIPHKSSGERENK